MKGLKNNFLKVAKSVTLYNAFRNRYLLTLVNADVAKKIAAITFDDGPDPIWTPKVLEILKKYDAKGTFFVLGTNVKKYPAIVKRAYDEGHSIANHTWDHPPFPLISRKERIKQLYKCKKIISEYDTKLFRPPYGYQDLGSRFDAFLLGYTSVGWDLHTYDWKDRSPEIMAKELNEGIHPGSIILLHDAINDQVNKDRSNLLKTLDLFLAKNNDYKFVTVPRLMKQGLPNQEIWFRKPNSKHLNSLKKISDKNQEFN